jgi:hypothetical protein
MKRGRKTIVGPLSLSSSHILSHNKEEIFAKVWPIRNRPSDNPTFSKEIMMILIIVSFFLFINVWFRFWHYNGK